MLGSRDATGDMQRDSASTIGHTAPTLRMSSTPPGTKSDLLIRCDGISKHQHDRLWIAGIEHPPAHSARRDLKQKDVVPTYPASVRVKFKFRHT